MTVAIPDLWETGRDSTRHTEVVVVVISFTLTSPLRGYAGYHNYGYPNLTTVNVQITCRQLLYYR